MLKLEQITLVDEKEHILIEGLNLLFENTGMISIHGGSEALNQQLCSLLAGVMKPKAGKIIYNNNEMSIFNEEERSMYRSCFTYYLTNDFQILQEESVYNNICMYQDFPLQTIIHELELFHLEKKLDDYVEDLSVAEQLEMILVRILLHHPMMIVFNTQTCSLSKQELNTFYVLLEKIKHRCLIVVIADSQCDQYAGRVIELQQKNVVSDSAKIEMVFPQVNHYQDRYKLSRIQLENVEKRMKRFIRFKLLLATILLIISFLSFTCVAFSKVIDVTDIQMRMLSAENYSVIGIEKQARDIQGNYLDNYYDYLNFKDIIYLNNKLNTKLILGYAPINMKGTRMYAYGSGELQAANIVDEFMIIEASSPQDLGFECMYGTFPKESNEIALSSLTAYMLLFEVLHEPFYNNKEQCEKMIGMRVLWMNQLLTISAIFPSLEKGNENMQYLLANYSDRTRRELMNRSFVVNKDFLENQEILMQAAYTKSKKRLILDDRVVAQFDGLNTVQSEQRYYDGSYKKLSTLGYSQVLFDYGMAMDLGFRSIYHDAINKGYDESKIQHLYEKFTQQWIGKKLTLQTYHIEELPQNTTIMNKKIYIHGFLLPKSFSAQDCKSFYHNEGKGTVYASKAILAPYLQKNVYIKNAFIHADKADMKKILSKLNQEKGFHAYLVNDRYFDFFIRDLKNIEAFMLILGCGCFLSFVYLFFFLWNSTLYHMYKELSVYYYFGVSQSALFTLVSRYFQMILWIRTIIACVCSLLLLAVLSMIIYTMLHASLVIFYAFVFPFIILLISVIIVRLLMVLFARYWLKQKKE